MEAEIWDWITVLLFKYSAFTAIYNTKGQLQSKKINKIYGVTCRKAEYLSIWAQKGVSGCDLRG